MMGSRPITITTSNIRAVTSEPGLEFQPAISSDGREVAYVEGSFGRIVVRSTIDIGAGETRLSDELDGMHFFPAWAPDGAFVRFVACGLEGCNWKEVGKLGGAVRAFSAPRGRHAWTRDGTRAAFAVRDSFYVSSVENGEPEFLSLHGGAHSLAWSPDGRFIAYVSGNSNWRTGTNVDGASIWILDASGGEPVQVTDREHLNVSPQWLPDSRHLLFVSSRDGPRGIYVVEVGADGAHGTPRSVLSSSDPHSISISADGRKLAYARFPGRQNIWSVPISRSGRVSIRDAVPVTTGNQIIENHSVSPDGEWIAFNSTLRGQSDIFKQRLDGGSAQLVADIPDHAFGPKWSPDGREIAFYGGGPIWIVSAEGGTAEHLTDFPGPSMRPEWSPDGLSIAFDGLPPNGGPRALWIASRDSIGAPWNEPVQVTSSSCQSAQWAPDGASIVCHDERGRWHRVSRDGAVISQYDAAAVGLEGLHSVRFSRDGSRIYFFSYLQGEELDATFWMPANGGDPTAIVALDDPMLQVYPTLTVGTEHLYLTILELDSDIWVMDLEW
jgi:TolB protein